MTITVHKSYWSLLHSRDANGDGTLDERLWVAQDANYNVTALFDNSGNVVERYIYDPFGQMTVLDADFDLKTGGGDYAWFHLHQGGRYDSVSGLYHFRHRDYSPTLGRWTSLDPLRYEAGDVNLYRYVFNTPTIYTDPSGLAAVPLADNFSPGIAVQNAGAGGLTGCGGGLWWAITFENRPDRAGNARLGYRLPGQGWQRSFHFDIDRYHPYPHINAEFGPLRGLNHTRIPNWLYRLGSTNVLRTVAKGTIVVGVAVDAYTIVTAPPGQRGQAIGGTVGGWGGAAAGAAIGSMICPGVGTVIGGLIGGLAGGSLGSWIGSWF